MSASESLDSASSIGKGGPTLNSDATPIERLRQAAAECGQDVVLLNELLWLLNIHPELPGFVQTCRHVFEICDVLLRYSNVAPLGVPLLPWLPLLRWVSQDSRSLAERVFPESFKKWDQDRERFLRTRRPNPLVRHGVKRYGLHGALWASHPDSKHQEQFRILQGHVMFAHIAIARRESSQV